MSRKYLIDANVLMTAHRQLYPFDLAPGFWNQLLEKSADLIIIIEQVDQEIIAGNDNLKDWYIENKDQFELLGIPEQAVRQSYAEIVNYVDGNSQYFLSAKEEFYGVADSWLCAYGLALGYPIVTLEQPKYQARKRILIPNICEDFNIEYIDLLKFMREIEIKLM